MPYVAEEIEGHATDTDAPVFAPRGAVKSLWTSRDRETIVSGPAETGKTWGCVQYLNALLWKYPAAQAVMCRKTYASLVGSALRTYRRILGDDTPVRAYGGEKPEWFDYPNGSRLWIVGLDNPTKALSSERDLIYVNQAEELSLEDWETLTTRCTGRGSVMPYTRMFGDCNPGPPSHWILHRPGLRMLESRHEDNPTLFDEDGGVTAQGEITLSVLDALTGARKGRLRFGRWMQSEGAVYEDWDAARNVIDRNDARLGLSGGVPSYWPRVWAVDFGFTNPFVWQEWAIDPDGRLLRLQEIYKPQRMVEDHAADIRKLTAGQPSPIAVICDHDAEGRATLERYLGVRTIPAYKGVADGIQAVAGRLRPAKDGLPRLLFLRGGVASPDEALTLARKPTCTEEEFDTYVWETGGGVQAKEHPHKGDDHGCFVAGTMVHTLDGPKPIEGVLPGEQVLTRQGFRRVVASGCTNSAAHVVTMTLSDGTLLTGTGNHPVFVKGKGFTPMDTIGYNVAISSIQENPFWKLSICPLKMTESSAFASMALFTAGIRRQRAGATGTTSVAALATKSAGTVRFIGTSGSFTTAKSRTDGKFTTLTATLSTTILRTLKPCPRENTMTGIFQTAGNVGPFHTRRPMLMCLPADRNAPDIGISPKKAGNGIGIMRRLFFRKCRHFNLLAKCAARSLMQNCFMLGIRVFVPTNAAPPFAVHPGLTTWKSSAPNASKRSRPTNMTSLNAAPVSVRSVISREGLYPVYNLTVEGEPEYYANGVLAHNCDATRYVVAWKDEISAGAGGELVVTNYVQGQAARRRPRDNEDY